MSQVGVSQIIAGSNVTISPPSGTGAVTINSTSSSIAKCASFARVVQTPLEARGSSASDPLVGIGSISFDAGPTPTDGFVIFTVNVANLDPANPLSALVGITNSLASSNFLFSTNTTMGNGNAQQVTIMYPLVNISGPQTIYGVAQQGFPNTPVNPQNVARNPCWSVVWGGNASIQPS
jgi:hypothetical protein